MNVICLSVRVIDYELAQDLVRAFLSAQFTGPSDTNAGWRKS